MKVTSKGIEMRKGGGKAKGSAFERQICKLLSLWISNGKQADLFWRSAMSGGRTTVAMRKGEKLSAQAGDISSIDRMGNAFIEKFMVECKSYKNLDFGGLIKQNGKLLEFWKRARDDAKTHGKFPILIAKQNQYPTIVCLDRDGMYLLKPEVLLRVVHAKMYIVTLEAFIATRPRALMRTRL